MSKYVKPDLTKVITTELPTIEKDGFRIFNVSDFDKLKKEIADTESYRELYNDNGNIMWIKVKGEGSGKYDENEVYDDEFAAKSSCIRHKFTCVFEGYDLKLFYDINRDYVSRYEWDGKDIGREIVQIYHDPAGDIEYTVVEKALKKGIFMLANREIVTIESERWEQEDGSLYVLCKSIDHPLAKDVPNGCVRSNMIYTGIWLQPVNNGKSMKYTLVTQADPSGWVPTRVVNWATRFLPKEFQADTKRGMDLRRQKPASECNYENCYDLSNKYTSSL